VVLVVFILLLFNLAGWFLWRISLDRLDDRLDRELFDLGRILSVYLDARLTDADDDSARDAALLDLTLYLEQAAGRTPLRRVFLFDRENRIYFDSRDEVEIGQKEPLLEADREQLERLWAGGEAATTFYPIEEGYAKRAYIPIGASGSAPQLGLGLEAGYDAFAALGRFRAALTTLTLVSLAVGAAAILILIQVMRRQKHIEEILSRTERAMEAGRLTAALAHELRNPFGMDNTQGIAQFAALAHELRNPLGIIHTNCEVLLRRLNDPDRETARDILEEVQRMSALVARFLNLSSQKPSEWQHCALGTLAQKAASRATAKAKERGIEIQVLQTGENDEIQAQPDRLESVLDNLIDNAIQAMEGRAGGRIEIEIRSNRKTVEAEFRDNGPGFSSDALQMALQPFYSGRPKGTGIGLTLARRIVEDHGGKLTLANRRQGGAIVRVTFKKSA